MTIVDIDATGGAIYGGVGMLDHLPVQDEAGKVLRR
jgi:hypothetical protein